MDIYTLTLSIEGYLYSHPLNWGISILSHSQLKPAMFTFWEFLSCVSNVTIITQPPYPFDLCLASGRLFPFALTLKDWLVAHRSRWEYLLCVIDLIPYTLYLMPYALYLMPYTLYLIPYTLYLIPYTLYLIPYTLYLIPYTLYLIPYTLYLIHYALYLIPYTFYLIPPSNS